MGFFKNLTRSLDPVKHIKEGFKNPGQSIKNNLARGLDPGGSVVRTGRGQQAMPTNFKQTYDPGGFTDVPPQPVAPNTYQPAQMRPLSAGAQQLYNDMMARSAARMSGQQFTAGTRGVPAAAPAAPAAAPAAPAAPVGVAAPTRIPSPSMGTPRMMADGGMVTKKRAKLDVDCHYENKSFERKPNGKPC